MRLFIGILLLSGLWACSRQKTSVSVDTARSLSPVFIGREENPLLHIRVDNTTGEEITCEEFVLSDAGTTNPEGIEKVSIYFTGLSERFDSSVLFGNTCKSGPQIIFRGRQVLKPGENHFWVSVSLNPSMRLTDEVNIHCTAAMIKGIETRLKDRISLPPAAVGYCLRKEGDDQVQAFRIPGLVYTPKGTLIAVYDIRHNNAVDLQEDIDVGVSRSLDRGQTWLPMQTAIDMGKWGGRPERENGVGDPAILVDTQTGRIWIAALWLHGHPGQRAWWASGPGITPEQTGQLVLVYSDDEGENWSRPVSITPQVKKPEWYLCFNGPGMGITTRNGTLVFAAQFKDKDQIPHSTILYSRDKGKSWHMGNGARSRTTEAQVVELEDGSLMLNMRDDRGGSRAVAVTKDFGNTWEEHCSSRSALPEPVCQASLLRIHLKDGRKALAFFNPADTLDRIHSTLKLSLDEGKSWPEKYHTLVYEPDSYGYSCLTQLDSTTLGVLYEGVGELYYQRLELDKIYP